VEEGFEVVACGVDVAHLGRLAVGLQHLGCRVEDLGVAVHVAEPGLSLLLHGRAAVGARGEHADVDGHDRRAHAGRQGCPGGACVCDAAAPVWLVYLADGPLWEDHAGNEQHGSVHGEDAVGLHAGDVGVVLRHAGAADRDEVGEEHDAQLVLRGRTHAVLDTVEQLMVRICGPAAARMASAFRDVVQGASRRTSWGTAPRRSQNKPCARGLKPSWSITRGLFARRRAAGSAAYLCRSASSRANHSSIAEMAQGCRMSLMEEGWKSDCWAGTGGAGRVSGGSKNSELKLNGSSSASVCSGNRLRRVVAATACEMPSWGTR
jgi:hypothetical protein